MRLPRPEGRPDPVRHRRRPGRRPRPDGPHGRPLQGADLQGRGLGRRQPDDGPAVPASAGRAAGDPGPRPGGGDRLTPPGDPASREYAGRRRADVRSPPSEVVSGLHEHRAPDLGIVQELLEDHQAAIERYRQALALYRRTDHTFGEAGTLGNMGIVLARLGDHPAAAERFERARALFRRLGHTGGEAHAPSNLGNARCRQGPPPVRRRRARCSSP
ncbi:hypothetical protein CW362_24430 [Streptomyces populi]|uniref:Tetratricopeptide repeat protein n=1 Tax=Streptomyces populi TaxID=2058924 RepID=A0A2I0SKE9_9ACTN|nr:hypothetical protein CW362_24430 [Streptomyces populi]